jgi:hypothetical protein
MGSDSTQVREIYGLQVAFHRAKTTQDIDFMISLSDVDATLNVHGNPNSLFVGPEQLKLSWQTSWSFARRRFSLVPSFKIQIEVHGDQPCLYFECHEVGDFDLPDRAIASDTFLAGTVRNIGGRWVFANIAAGKAFPLSVDHYYFP